MKTRLFVSAAITLVLCAAPFTALARELPVLNRGMPAEVITDLVGRPDEVSKIESDQFHAETWIYRRKVEQTVFQTANMQAYIPAMVGFDSGGLVIGKTIVPDYRLKYAAAYQVTALLMVNGKLYLGRQWVAQNEEYAN